MFCSNPTHVPQELAQDPVVTSRHRGHTLLTFPRPQLADLVS
jgi:hypothetical protein